MMIEPQLPDEQSSGSLPARRLVDRATLDRVLARAAELQLSGGMPAEGALTEEQLLELGREVGLSAEHLRQALAEERTRVIVPPEQGFLSSLIGPAATTSSRTVRGTPADVLAALDRWMMQEECLQVKRRFTDRIVWEARRDLVGNIKRGFNIGGRGYELSRADEVAATVVALDGNRVLVRLDASLRDKRWQRVGMGAGTVGAGLATFTVLAILGVMIPVAVIPAGAALGLGVGHAMRHRQLVERVQLAFEQVLDRLEHGELTRTASGSVLGGLLPGPRPPRR